MIFINYHDSESTVYPVIDWLYYLGIEYTLINQNSSVFEFKNVSIINSGISFNLSEETEGKRIEYWNRRSLPFKLAISSVFK